MANNPNATANLKPFTRNDKRINRDGRPKNSVELGALFRRIGAEVATDKSGNPIIGPDGKPLTVVELIARQKAQDKRHQEEFLDRAYGKVATPVDLTSKGQRITGFAMVSPTDWEHGDKDSSHTDENTGA